jgi:hypothetical protein
MALPLSPSLRKKLERGTNELIYCEILDLKAMLTKLINQLDRSGQRSEVPESSTPAPHE